MTYILSLLDKSPIPQGSDAVEAFAQTLARVRRAEELGYHRYWLAEHHGSTTLAGSAPEILAAWALAQTKRIRIGTGGVMLQHYSPFKVAEAFKLLSSLAPGRVDLGIGKAPGGLPATTRALQARHAGDLKPDFAAQLTDLDHFLTGVIPEEHPHATARALPEPPELPQKILLGGSVDSATLAARLGWQFAYAGHFDGNPENIDASLAAYRALTGRPALLALFAFVADNDEAARQAVGEIKIFTVHLPNGTKVNLPSEESARSFAAQSGFSDYRLQEKHPGVLTGTSDRVRRELGGLAERYGIQEFIIDIPVADYAARLRSIELLARASIHLAA
jgi:luciferase family oxidoreductase group 1